MTTAYSQHYSVDMEPAVLASSARIYDREGRRQVARLRIYPTWMFSDADDCMHLTVQAESGEVQLHLEEVKGPDEVRLHLEFFMDPEDALAVSAALSEASISARALKDADSILVSEEAMDELRREHGLPKVELAPYFIALVASIEAMSRVQWPEA